MAQWWERSPPTSVARVRFPVPLSYVGWVCCWFSSLLRGFFSGFFSFPPSTKTNISKFHLESVVEEPLCGGATANSNLFIIFIYFIYIQLTISIANSNSMEPKINIWVQGLLLTNIIVNKLTTTEKLKKKWRQYYYLMTSNRRYSSCTHLNKVWPLSHWVVSRQLAGGGVKLLPAVTSASRAVATSLTASCIWADSSYPWYNCIPTIPVSQLQSYHLF